ncbi:MAG: hypothetical protein JNL10_06005 [Verrucomicrobiales bacterium]|nr:hypothetical protein [Verrucomicrobiales bacterium]
MLLETGGRGKALETLTEWQRRPLDAILNCPNMCKLNTPEQSPMVVWEQDGDALHPRFVRPDVAEAYQLEEGDEINAGMRRTLQSVGGLLPLGSFERMIPSGRGPCEPLPPVAVIEH